MRTSRGVVSALGAAVLVGSSLLIAAPAFAAQSLQGVTCDGHQLTIRTNDNRSSDNGGWPTETDLSLKMTVTNLMFHLSNKRADA